MLGASPPALRQAPAGTVGTIPTLEGPPSSRTRARAAAALSKAERLIPSRSAALNAAAAQLSMRGEQERKTANASLTKM
jgi:hypothetical protein